VEHWSFKKNLVFLLQFVSKKVVSLWYKIK
jgi:hypothetical protein